MPNIIKTIIGDLQTKTKYRQFEKRAKALPPEYRAAYGKIKQYLWTTAGVVGIAPFKALIELFEEAAAHHRRIADITGPDVAAFADELARGETSWLDIQHQKLNNFLR